MVCNAMRILYVLSFLFFGYDLHNNNNNNYYKNNNFNTHNIINTRTCRPTSTHTSIHDTTMHYKLHIPTQMPTATLITRNSTPQHAPSSSRTRTTSVSVGVPEHPVKVKPPLTIVGDVNGRIAIMVVSMNKLILYTVPNTSFHWPYRMT